MMINHFMMMNTRRLAAQRSDTENNRATVVQVSSVPIQAHQLNRRRRILTMVIIVVLIGYPSIMGISRLMGLFDKDVSLEGEGKMCEKSPGRIFQ